MESQPKLGRYDFEKALKGGLSKSEIVGDLRNYYDTNVDWEKLNTDLKDLPKTQRDNIAFDILYNNQDIWGIKALKTKELPTKQKNRALKETQIQSIEQEVQNMPQWAIDSAMLPHLAREAVGINGFWNLFKSKEAIAQDNALKNAYDKQIDKKLSKGEDLSIGEMVRYYQANDMGEFFSPQKHYQKQQELNKIAQTSFENLEESQKQELKRQNLISRLWNSDQELHEKLKDEQTKKQADAHTQARAQELERDIINLQRTYQNVLKSGVDWWNDSTEQSDRYKDMILDNAISLGFDGVGFRGDRIYAYKGDKAIYIDDGFFHNLGQIIGTNAFDIGGSIAGAIAGAKRGTGKIGKLAGAVVGGAVGAGLGGIADSIRTQYAARGEFNLADALLTGAESATFDVAGGLIVGTGAKAVQGAVKGVQNLLSLNPFPLTSTLKNFVGSENIQAAKELVEQSFTQEQKSDILDFSKSFGGNLELDGKTTPFSKGAEYLSNKYGADSSIAKVANTLESYSKAHNKAQAREEMLTLIRADESGQSLGILLEVAKNSNEANRNLREILNATSYKLKREIESLGLEENAMKKVFNDLEKGTKEDYDEAFNKILGDLYENEKVVLNGEAYHKMREDMAELIELDPQGLGFLKFVEKGIYNPQGVSFKQLDNARKLLNSYYKEATNPSTKEFIKNSVESAIRGDIEKGINEIFLTHPSQYESAKRLYDTALSDYASMRETLKTLNNLGFNDYAKTNAQLMDSLISYIQGSGGIKEVNNYATLTKGLKKEQIESLELNALNRIYEKNLIKDSKDSTFEVFNSQGFLNDSAKLSEIFQSQSARQFLEIMQGFNKLFGNDATIALKLGFANPQKEGSAIAQSVKGAIEQKIVKGIFGILMRNLPTSNKMIDKLGFKEKVQKMALSYHIEQALKGSYSINDFHFALKKISDDPNTPTPTREAIESFNKELTKLLAEAQENAELGKNTKELELALGKASTQEPPIPQELKEQWLREFNLKSLDEDFIPQIAQEAKEALEKAGISGDIHLKIGSLVKLESRDRLEFLHKIRPTLETPNAIVKQNDGALIFVKDFGETKYFSSVSRNEAGEWVVTSNAPKSLNNLKNKLIEGGEVLYSNLPELPIIAKPELPAKALNNEANATDIIPQSSLKESLERKKAQRRKELELALGKANTQEPPIPQELNNLDLSAQNQKLREQDFTLQGKAKQIPTKTEIPINPQIKNHLDLESDTLKADLEKLKNTHPELFKTQGAVARLIHKIQENPTFFFKNNRLDMHLVGSYVRDNFAELGIVTQGKNIGEVGHILEVSNAKKRINTLTKREIEHPLTESVKLGTLSKRTDGRNGANALSEGNDIIPQSSLKESLERKKAQRRKELELALDKANTQEPPIPQELSDIVFKDAKGNDKILTKETQNLWLQTFNLKSLDEEFAPNIPQEISQKLGKEIKLNLKDLKKIVANKREKYLSDIKATFEKPQAVFIDESGDLLFAKTLDDKLFFVNVNRDYGESFKGISLSPKKQANLLNKLRNAKEVYYNELASELRDSTAQQASTGFLSSTSKANDKIIPQSKEIDDVDFNGSVRGLPLPQKQSQEIPQELSDIVFKDAKGNDKILTKETQNLWLQTFNLKSIEDTYTPKHSEAIKQALGGKEIKLQLGSLKKLVAQSREQYIPQVKEVLDKPETILSDSDNTFLFIKHLKDEDYFVNVSVDKGEYLVSISNGIKEVNNLKNKLQAGAEVIYQSPNANSNLQTLLQASRYSTNEIDNAHSTTNAQPLQTQENTLRHFERSEESIKSLKQESNILESNAFENLNDKESREIIKENLKNIINTTLKSSDGIEARISNTSIAKMTSTKAVQKSVDNGFTKSEHFQAVANLQNIYQNARLKVTHADKKGSKDLVAIHRLTSKINDKTQALITLKESVNNGKKIYSLELELSPTLPIDSSPISKKAGDLSSIEAGATNTAVLLQKSNPNFTTTPLSLQETQANALQVRSNTMPSFKPDEIIDVEIIAQEPSAKKQIAYKRHNLRAKAIVSLQKQLEQIDAQAIKQTSNGDSAEYFAKQYQSIEKKLNDLKAKQSQEIPQAVKDIIDSSPQKGRDMQTIGGENLTPEVVKYVQNKNKKVAIEILSETEAKALGFKYPSDVRVTIDFSAINHTINRHGSESHLTKLSGQKAVTYEDIANYREIIKNADETLKGIDNSGNPVLVSYKQVNGHFVVVEQIKKKNNELGFKTLFKGEGSYKQSKSYKDTAKAQTLSIGYEPSANSFALANPNFTTTPLPLQEKIQALKAKRRKELEKAMQEKRAKEAEASQKLREAQREKQRQKDAQVGKAINQTELNLDSAIDYKELKPTMVNLENKSYPAKFVIIKKEDLKPSFETKGTQGRTQKQGNVIKEIQENLNPNKLFFSEGGFEGLPVILKDGQVSVGNHRSEALKNLSKESQEAYKQSAKEVFGVDLRDDELIVRMLDESLDKDSKRIYTLELEELESAKPFAPAPNGDLTNHLTKPKEKSDASLTPLENVSLNSTTNAQPLQAPKASNALQVRSNTMPSFKPDEIIDVEIIAQEPSAKKQIAYKRHNLRAKAIVSLQKQLEQIDAQALKQTSNGDSAEYFLKKYQNAESKLKELENKQGIPLNTQRKQALQELASLKGQESVNLNDGRRAVVAKDSLEKMLSGKAIGKSLENGFSVEQHLKAVSEVLELFRKSHLMESEAPRNRSADIVAFHKYLADFEQAQAKITIKELTQGKNKVYSLELLELTPKAKHALPNENAQKGLDTSYTGADKASSATTPSSNLKDNFTTTPLPLQETQTNAFQPRANTIPRVQADEIIDVEIIAQEPSAKKQIAYKRHNLRAKAIVSLQKQLEQIDAQALKQTSNGDSAEYFAKQYQSIEKKLNDLKTKQSQEIPQAEQTLKSNISAPLSPAQIKEQIDKWDLENPRPQDRLLLSKVEGEELAQLEKEFDFKGNYEIAREIDAQHIAHAINRHSLKDSNIANISISVDEILQYYPNITKNFDKRAIRGNSIIYTKQVNGHFIAIEEVLTGKNKLRFETAWKQKGDLNEEVLFKNAKVFPNATHKVASDKHSLDQILGGTSHNQNPSITTPPTPSSLGHDLDRTLSGGYASDIIPQSVTSLKGQTNLPTKQEAQEIPIHTLRQNTRTMLKGRVNKEITNKNTNEVAMITNKGIAKMISDKAVQKSVDNGFTKEAHFKAVENVESLFANATKAFSKSDDIHKDLIIHRYNAPFENANALLTLKEYKLNGKKIYSLELEQLNAIKFNPNRKDLMEQLPKSKDESSITSLAPIDNPTDIIPQSSLKESLERKKAQRRKELELALGKANTQEPPINPTQSAQKEIGDKGLKEFDFSSLKTSEAKAKLRDYLQSQNVLNSTLKSSDGIEATFSLNSLSKMTSLPAIQKSVNNGFSRNEHLNAVANIKEIFANAKRTETQPHKSGDLNVKIHRMQGKFNEAGVLITLKESLDKNQKRLYSIELQLIPSLKGADTPLNKSTSKGDSLSLQETKGGQKAESSIEKTDSDIIPQESNPANNVQYKMPTKEKFIALRDAVVNTFRKAQKEFNDATLESEKRELADKIEGLLEAVKNIESKIIDIEFGKLDPNKPYSELDFLENLKQDLGNVEIESQLYRLKKEYFGLDFKNSFDEVENFYRIQYPERITKKGTLKTPKHFKYFLRDNEERINETLEKIMDLKEAFYRFNKIDKDLKLEFESKLKTLEYSRKGLEEELNLHPTPAFGTNYVEYFRDGKGAIEKLIAESQEFARSGEKGEFSGQVAGAFYREDIGDITLVWGEKGTGKSDGWGLSKIVEYHPEILDKLDDLVQNLPIIKESANRYKLDNGDFFLSIRKDFEGKKENWVLTGFEKEESIARRRTNLPSSQSEAEKTTSANATDIIPQSSLKESLERKKAQGLKEFDFSSLKTSEAKAKLRDYLQSQNVLNHTLKSSDGIEATFSLNSLSKMTSLPAIQKSVNNGFSRNEHLNAVANIKEIFANARLRETHADKKGSNDLVAIHRLTSNINDEAQALITLKESVNNGKKIYSLELQLAPSLKSADTPLNKSTGKGDSLSLQETKGGQKAESPIEKTDSDIIPQNAVSLENKPKAKAKLEKEIAKYEDRIRILDKKLNSAGNVARKNYDSYLKEKEHYKDLLTKAENEYYAIPSPSEDLAYRKFFKSQSQDDLERIFSTAEDESLITPQNLKEFLRKEGNEYYLKRLKDYINDPYGLKFRDEIESAQADMRLLKKIAQNHNKDLELKYGAENRANIEKAFDIHPNPAFGTNYVEYFRDGKGAIEKLIAESQEFARSGEKGEFSGQVAGAFYREDIGDIDLVWGKVTDAQNHKGFGLAHIIDKHLNNFEAFRGNTPYEKVANGMSEIVEKGKVVTQAKGRSTIIYNKGDKTFRIGLKANYKGEPTENKWIITAYEDEEASKFIHSKGFTKGEALPLNSTDIIPQSSLKESLERKKAQRRKELELALGKANVQEPHLPIQSNPHIGAGLLGGSVAGVEEDAQGNLTFDPAKFALGFLGGAAGSKGIAKGYERLEYLRFKKKQREELRTLRDFTKKHLSEIRNQDIVNKSGTTARLSSVGIAKMSSDKAIQKSINNGFNTLEHFEAVNNIKNLFIQADFLRSERPKNQSKDIVAVHRFIAKNALKNKGAQALITLKESVQNGNRIYSLELEELKPALPSES